MYTQAFSRRGLVHRPGAGIEGRQCQAPPPSPVRRSHPAGSNPKFAWKWAYSVQLPNGGILSHSGHGLQDARDWAGKNADQVTEAWEGGKRWTKGPRGGLRLVVTDTLLARA